MACHRAERAIPSYFGKREPLIESISSLPEYRSKHLEQIDLTANGNLLGFSQSREPLLELFGRFDVLRHSWSYNTSVSHCGAKTWPSENTIALELWGWLQIS